MELGAIHFAPAIGWGMACCCESNSVRLFPLWPEAGKARQLIPTPTPQGGWGRLTRAPVALDQVRQFLLTSDRAIHFVDPGAGDPKVHSCPIEGASVADQVTFTLASPPSATPGTCHKIGMISYITRPRVAGEPALLHTPALCFGDDAGVKAEGTPPPQALPSGVGMGSGPVPVWHEGRPGVACLCRNHLVVALHPQNGQGEPETIIVEADGAFDSLRDNPATGISPFSTPADGSQPQNTVPWRVYFLDGEGSAWRIEVSEAINSGRLRHDHELRKVSSGRDTQGRPTGMIGYPRMLALTKGGRLYLFFSTLSQSRPRWVERLGDINLGCPPVVCGRSFALMTRSGEVAFMSNRNSQWTVTSSVPAGPLQGFREFPIAPAFGEGMLLLAGSKDEHRTSLFAFGFS